MNSNLQNIMLAFLKLSLYQRHLSVLLVGFFFNWPCVLKTSTVTDEKNIAGAVLCIPRLFIDYWQYYKGCCRSSEDIQEVSKVIVASLCLLSEYIGIKNRKLQHSYTPAKVPPTSTSCLTSTPPSLYLYHYYSRCCFLKDVVWGF